MIKVSWKIIDVYFNSSEENAVKKEGEKLIKNGYKLYSEDDGAGKYEFCNQYIKVT